MVSPEYIGKSVYSKKLKRNFDIIEGPNDEYWRCVGLEFILVHAPKKERQKFPKVDTDTTEHEQ